MVDRRYYGSIASQPPFAIRFYRLLREQGINVLQRHLLRSIMEWTLSAIATVSFELKVVGDEPALLEDTDIFVLVPDSEGFSVSDLESRTSGIPDVVTDVIGNRGLLDGRSGNVVQHGGDRNLCQRIFEIVESNKIRTELGNVARYRARKKLDLAKMSDAYTNTMSSMSAQRA